MSLHRDLRTNVKGLTDRSSASSGSDCQGASEGVAVHCRAQLSGLLAKLPEPNDIRDGEWSGVVVLL
jgi:hypothetical protein